MTVLGLQALLAAVILSNGMDDGPLFTINAATYGLWRRKAGWRALEPRFTRRGYPKHCGRPMRRAEHAAQWSCVHPECGTMRSDVALLANRRRTSGQHCIRCTGFRCSHRACRLKKRARMVPRWLRQEAAPTEDRYWRDMFGPINPAAQIQFPKWADE